MVYAFRKPPEKLRKKWVRFYTYFFPEPSVASREIGAGPLLQCCISVVRPPRVMVKYVHIFRARSKENKEKKGTIGSP